MGTVLGPKYLLRTYMGPLGTLSTTLSTLKMRMFRTLGLCSPLHDLFGPLQLAWSLFRQLMFGN